MQQYRWQAAAKANQTNSLPADMTDMDQFVTYQFVPVSDCDLTAAVMQTYQSLLKAYDTETEREGWLLTGVDALNYLYRNFPETSRMTYANRNSGSGFILIRL